MKLTCDLRFIAMAQVEGVVGIVDTINANDCEDPDYIAWLQEHDLEKFYRPLKEYVGIDSLDSCCDLDVSDLPRICQSIPHNVKLQFNISFKDEMALKKQLKLILQKSQQPPHVRQQPQQHLIVRNLTQQETVYFDKLIQTQKRLNVLLKDTFVTQEKESEAHYNRICNQLKSIFNEFHDKLTNIYQKNYQKMKNEYKLNHTSKHENLKGDLNNLLKQTDSMKLKFMKSIQFDNMGMESYIAKSNEIKNTSEANVVEMKNIINEFDSLNYICKEEQLLKKNMLSNFESFLSESRKNMTEWTNKQLSLNIDNGETQRKDIRIHFNMTRGSGNDNINVNVNDNVDKDGIFDDDSKLETIDGDKITPPGAGPIIGKRANSAVVGSAVFAEEQAAARRQRREAQLREEERQIAQAKTASLRAEAARRQSQIDEQQRQIEQQIAQLNMIKQQKVQAQQQTQLQNINNNHNNLVVHFKDKDLNNIIRQENQVWQCSRCSEINSVEHNIFCSKCRLKNINYGLLKVIGVISPLDGYKPGESRTVGWILLNISNHNVKANAQLSRISGDTVNVGISVKFESPFDINIKPNETICCVVQVTVPIIHGKYEQVFQLVDSNNFNRLLCSRLPITYQVNRVFSLKHEKRITQMYNMGFTDRPKIVGALLKQKWNVDDAMNQLLKDI